MKNNIRCLVRHFIQNKLQNILLIVNCQKLVKACEKTRKYMEFAVFYIYRKRKQRKQYSNTLTSEIYDTRNKWKFQKLHQYSIMQHYGKQRGKKFPKPDGIRLEIRNYDGQKIIKFLLKIYNKSEGQKIPKLNTECRCIMSD